jgi:uncharacterized membrane protein YbaN (DUF454 family)
VAIVGVFVPGIPTTEFVLAASYYSRAARRVSSAGSRAIGGWAIAAAIQETRGMPRQAKLLALAWMWTGLGLSIYALSTLACRTDRSGTAWRDRHR